MREWTPAYVWNKNLFNVAPRFNNELPSRPQQYYELENINQHRILFNVWIDLGSCPIRENFKSAGQMSSFGHSSAGNLTNELQLNLNIYSNSISMFSIESKSAFTHLPPVLRTHRIIDQKHCSCNTGDKVEILVLSMFIDFYYLL